MEKIPVHIISGFLGSGKTTLTRHIEKFRTLFPGKLFYISSENLFLYLTSPGLTGKSDLPLYRAIIDAASPGTDVIYDTKTLQFDGTTIFDPVMLHRFFRENPCILRAKGNILSSRGWLLINYTASGFTCEPSKSYESSQVVLIYDRQNFF